MKFHIVVLAKQVPDVTDVSENVMKPDGTLNREALPSVINPEDLNALEEALKIKDRFDAKVTVLSMGPPKAYEVLKECMIRGADEGILLTDKVFAGSDTQATSYVLARAIEKLEKFDMIFCGRQAIDGDTAQVGPQVAEKLKINQLTYVFDLVRLDEKEVVVKREIEGGYEVVKSKLPVLLTITSKANEPRPRNVKRAMALKNIKVLSSKEVTKNSTPFIKKWNHEDIGADPDKCGLNGSPTKVKKVESVVLKKVETQKVANNDEELASMFKQLVDDHIIA